MRNFLIRFCALLLLHSHSLFTSHDLIHRHRSLWPWLYLNCSRAEPQRRCSPVPVPHFPCRRWSCFSVHFFSAFFYSFVFHHLPKWDTFIHFNCRNHISNLWWFFLSLSIPLYAPSSLLYACLIAPFGYWWVYLHVVNMVFMGLGSKFTSNANARSILLHWWWKTTCLMRALHPVCPQQGWSCFLQFKSLSWGWQDSPVKSRVWYQVLSCGHGEVGMTGAARDRKEWKRIEN